LARGEKAISKGKPVISTKRRLTPEEKKGGVLAEKLHLHRSGEKSYEKIFFFTKRATRSRRNLLCSRGK